MYVCVVSVLARIYYYWEKIDEFDMNTSTHLVNSISLNTNCKWNKATTTTKNTTTTNHWFLMASNFIAHNAHTLRWIYNIYISISVSILDIFCYQLTLHETSIFVIASEKSNKSSWLKGKSKKQDKKKDK